MRFFLALAITFSGLFSFGQQYNFITYSVDDGLPQSQVNVIDQDQFGYLWIGTQTGLSQFDGINFKNFSVSDGLTDNKIDEILIYGDKIWVASRRGISEFQDGKFAPTFFTGNTKVNDLLWDKNRVLLATDNGLLQLQNGKIGQAHTDSSDLKVRSIVNCGDKVFCGTPDGLYTFSNDTFQKIPTFDSLSWNISDLECQNDTIYLATYGRGVWMYMPKTDKLELVSDKLVNVRDVFVSDNVVQIGTKNGLQIHTPSEDLILNQSNGLMVEEIKCSYKDAEGNTWIGTDGGGLLKYVGDALISYGVKDGLSSNAVMSINQIGDSYLFGTYNAGLTLYGSSSVVFNERSGISDDRVWGVEVLGDAIFLATDRGVTRILNNQVYKFTDTVSNHKLRSILKVDSILYFGGVKGLIQFSENKGFQVVGGTEDLNVNKIIELNSEIFIGANTGLFILDSDGLKQVNLPENDVNTLCKDMDGNLWIGTTDGLFAYNSGSVLSVELNPSEFKSRHILGITQGRNSVLWVATTYGVYNLKIEDKEKYKVEINEFGKVEGLVNLECNLNAIFEDKLGFIWVGTSTGLCRIDPNKTEELFNLEPPKIQFIDLRLFLEKFDFNEYKVDVDPVSHLPSSITLPHNKNHLTFDFMGINLSDPKSVKYEYRLLGLDENWSPLQQDNYATYSFISPGEYIFEVRAANKNFEWSTTISMKVIILSPFWKTWWFIALMSLVALLLVTIIFRIRIKSIKQRQTNEKLEYKNRLQLLEQRSLNASMNRHFIFNSLNSIQYYINSSDKRSANKYLTSFAKLIRMNLDSSVQNNFIIPLQEEIDRIELYLNLEKMRFQGKFEFNLDVDSELDLESIEIPSMILQPFVENALIHGILPLQRKGNITISIFEEFEDLVFEVVDDGIGIDESLSKKQEQSAGDHESKGVEITNRRIELLRRITGDQLLIVGPYQRNNEAGDCLGTKVVIKMPMNISQNF